MEQWIEEFLYRGRPQVGPGSEAPASYHVMVGQRVPSGFGGEQFEQRIIGPLTATEAADMGLPISALFTEISDGMTAALDAANAARIAAERRATEAEEANRLARGQIKGLLDDADKMRPFAIDGGWAEPKIEAAA